MSRFLNAVFMIILSQTVFAETPASSTAKPFDTVPEYTYKVVHTYPHDPKAFTQGLAIENGILYEGTGLYGKSSLRRVDLHTGDILQNHNLPSTLFGEGITVKGNRVIQLTWKSKFGLVYDKNTFELLQVFKYEGEGWGITHDESSLIMSDGSETIKFLDPETFQEKRRIQVMDEQGLVTALNELEYVNGSIYANIWKSDRIAIIDPQTGKVTGWIDLAGILNGNRKAKGKSDVLNGIAYDPYSNALYVTGKLWPKIFQVEVVPQQSEK